MLDVLRDPHRRHLALTILVGTGLAAYLSGTLDSVAGFDLALLLTLAGGFPIFHEAASALIARRITASLAVSLAAIAALAIGEFLVAAEVIFIMLVGEALEHYAVDRTRAGIAALLALRPHEARVRRGGIEQSVPADQVLADDIVLLRPGDRIPVDGRVIAGSSSVDESPITGESLPADKTSGGEVFAGTINLHGALEVTVERVGESTTLETIIHLVEHAEAAKAPAQRLADRWAVWFVPIVLAVAVATYVVARDPVRSVAVLVVACPCALVLATPAAVAAALGGLVRRGILVKGGNALETLGRVRSVIFDKTGTLTLARLHVSRILAAEGIQDEEVLRLAAAVEWRSEHPVARAIVEEAERRGLELAAAADFAARPGLGTEASVGGLSVLVGSERFLKERDVSIGPDLASRLRELQGSTVVVVARGVSAIGAIAAADAPRPEAREAIASLRELDVSRIVLLTGDREAAARSVAESVRISETRAGLLPAEKVEAVREIRTSHGPAAMVGDGINDAPALVAADVGIAMADVGSDIAVESAGVVLVGGDLLKVADAVETGRRMRRILRQNILGFALGFNALAVAAASLGWVSPVAAAVVHQASSLTVILNSLRLLVDARKVRQRLAAILSGIRARRRRILASGAAAALVLWVLSGIHVVGVGETAVVLRFGRAVRLAEPPGIHWRLPWPLGRHAIVRPQEVRRAEVGFRTVPGRYAEPPAYEWNIQHRGGRTERQAEEAAVLAGDENLADTNLVVHYRVAAPDRALFRLGSLDADRIDKWDRLVRAVAEEALRAEMARRPVDGLLAYGRSELEAAILGRMQERLSTELWGLAVVRVALADVHPPLEVVPAFREVASALEEKEARINEAEAYRQEAGALTRGRSAETIERASGAAADRTLRAAGSAARFLSLATAYATARDVTRLRLWLETAERLLRGRKKFIVDREEGRGRRQLFLGPRTMWSPALPDPAARDPEAGEGTGAEAPPGGGRPR